MTAPTVATIKSLLWMNGLSCSNSDTGEGGSTIAIGATEKTNGIGIASFDGFKTNSVIGIFENKSTTVEYTVDLERGDNVSAGGLAFNPQGPGAIDALDDTKNYVLSVVVPVNDGSNNGRQIITFSDYSRFLKKADGDGKCGAVLQINSAGTPVGALTLLGLPLTQN